MREWTEASLQSLIQDQVEESLSLEYKRAASLGRSDGRKREITKDISSFANSSGGTIIYGIAEYDDQDKKHLPELFDPVNRKEYSREWLDQIINTIQPRIDGIIIIPVTLSSSQRDVIYVVEVPQSSTAHQARAKKYYKRYNCQSLPMDDYEIRDVMARAKFPELSVGFEIEKKIEKSGNILGQKSTKSDTRKLVVTAKNEGSILAKYVNIFANVPYEIVDEIVKMQVTYNNEKLETIDGVEHFEYFRENTTRDIVDYETGLQGMSPKYGPSRFDPILPGLSHTWRIDLMDDLEPEEHPDLSIRWNIFCDNAPKKEGVISLVEIPTQRIGDSA